MEPHRLQRKTDAVTAAGGFSGLGGTSGGGERDQVGLGAELLIPILEELELTVAGRYDHYFDDSATGGAFTPKVSLAYRPTDTLLLRGSYGLGFRAPDLKRLFGNETRGFGSGFDPALCASVGGLAQMRIFQNVRLNTLIRSTVQTLN